jgi:hypothetical protein
MAEKYAKAPSGLDVRKEAFCQHICDGMNQTDAWERSHPPSIKGCKDGKPRSKKTAHTGGSVLMNRADIKERIAEIQKERQKAIEERVIWTHMQSQEVLASIAKEQHDGEVLRAGDRISAVKELNNMLGFHAAVKQEVSVSGTVEYKHEHVHLLAQFSIQDLIALGKGLKLQLRSEELR